MGEHAPIGMVLGTVRASDVDSSDILTHELTEGNASLFAIDMATGRITVNAKLDFETAPDSRRRDRQAVHVHRHGVRSFRRRH